jgi:hypothetical protein
MRTKRIKIKAGEEIELHLRGQNKLSLTQNIRGPATVSIIEVHREKTTKQRTGKTQRARKRT